MYNRQRKKSESVKLGPPSPKAASWNFVVRKPGKPHANNRPKGRPGAYSVCIKMRGLIHLVFNAPRGTTRYRLRTRRSRSAFYNLRLDDFLGSRRAAGQSRCSRC